LLPLINIGSAAFAETEKNQFDNKNSYFDAYYNNFLNVDGCYDSKKNNSQNINSQHASQKDNSKNHPINTQIKKPTKTSSEIYLIDSDEPLISNPVFFDTNKNFTPQQCILVGQAPVEFITPEINLKF
jgi:hypothetical protein